MELSMTGQSRKGGWWWDAFRVFRWLDANQCLFVNLVRRMPSDIFALLLSSGDPIHPAFVVL